MGDKKNKMVLEFKDVVALSVAIFRMIIPKLLIMILSIWLAGIIIVNLLG